LGEDKDDGQQVQADQVVLIATVVTDAQEHVEGIVDGANDAEHFGGRRRLRPNYREGRGYSLPTQPSRRKRLPALGLL
jgi:hypothetical protein